MKKEKKHNKQIVLEYKGIIKQLNTIIKYKDELIEDLLQGSENNDEIIKKIKETQSILNKNYQLTDLQFSQDKV